MTPPDLGDDDSLLALLAECIDEADPTPTRAVEAAKTLARLADADAELAVLVADSLVDDEVVLFRRDVTMEHQGQASDRLISFATPDLHVDVDLHADDGSVVGAINPAMISDVDLETIQGKITTASDELGRFHFDAPSGRCRLRFHLPYGVVVTPWITR